MLKVRMRMVFQHNATMAVKQGEHPHHPRMPSLPEGVVITEQQYAAIYKFLLDMNFSSSRKMRWRKLNDRGPSFLGRRLTTVKGKGAGGGLTEFSSFVSSEWVSGFRLNVLADSRNL